MLWTFSQDPRGFCSSLSAPQNKGTTEKRIWMLGLQGLSVFSATEDKDIFWKRIPSSGRRSVYHVMNICNTKCNMCLNTHSLWSEGERSRSTHDRVGESESIQTFTSRWMILGSQCSCKYDSPLAAPNAMCLRFDQSRAGGPPWVFSTFTPTHDCLMIAFLLIRFRDKLSWSH
jgi:hypothetical protein